MAISEYYMLPPMPEGLEGLAELGLDLRWSWSHKSDVLWEQINSELWDLTRNPWLILQSISGRRLKELAGNKYFKQELQEQVEQYRKYLKDETWFSRTQKNSSMTIAYLGMEFGLSESLPIYSGGLGILAGDVLKTASDLGVPVVGIGLLYQQGYFRQVINSEGRQIEYYPYNDPSQLPILPLRDKEGQWLYVNVQFPGRVVKLRIWEAKVGRVKLYLLDSNDPSNGPADQCITAELYGGGHEMRLQQEMILGIGGWRTLNALGIKAQVCHLNEGHAALAVIERARMFAKETKQTFEVALEATKAGNVFTTHTPVAAGFDRFAPSLVYQYLRGYAESLDIGIEGLINLGRENPGDTSEPLNMAYLAVRGSGIVNAVSSLHGQVSRQIFQNLFPRWPQWEIPITHVTNGVHVPSWDSESADKLWTETCGKDRWIGTLDTLESGMKKISDETLWEFRCEGRFRLVEYVRDRLARQLEASGASEEKLAHAREILNPDVFTIGFARRFAAYKRPNLLMYDPQRLKALLLNSERPVQIIIAGKAHPHDEQGKTLIASWSDFIRQSNAHSHVIFLADYDMSLAEHLVQGVDLWINTPRRPWEASGTSGMKVLVNGGLNFSELDGWWSEAYKPEVGWALGDRCEHGDDLDYDACEARQLYRILEEEIVPSFYERNAEGIPTRWVSKIRTSMTELTPRFSSNRMLREYVEKLYLPSLAAFQERSKNKAAKSKKLSNYKKTIQDNFSKINFGNIEVNSKNGQYYYKVPVFFDGIEPDNIAVQLF
ncbi:MAG: alpha-glucan family phosphorylase, partial [Sedimentisphaerales bacterium]|nr:alpha-glucan family phosphorylase [Sedimentisphaerales bacterium]